jgi:acetyl esterase/lipase
MHSTGAIGLGNRRRFPYLIAAVALALLFALVATPTTRADAVEAVEVEQTLNIPYTDPVPDTTQGNLLDLYIPDVHGKKLPLIIWSSGSAWLGNTGKEGAAPIAAVFNPLGYAVAGVSVRSTGNGVPGDNPAHDEVAFPGQLHDIRAAIRWLREHAREYNLDTRRFAIMGNSSGGWLAAIAGTTSDIRRLPGEEGVGRTSSAVQAAVPFFPPTDFLQMDQWYVDNPGVFSLFVHDLPLVAVAPPWIPIAQASPESMLVHCTDDLGQLLGIQTCPEETQEANPISYVDRREVPMMILHGEADSLVPNGQSVLLYQALRDARNRVTFISVQGAGHCVEQPPAPQPPFCPAGIIGADQFTVFTSFWGQEKVGDHPAPTWENIEKFIRQALGIPPNFPKHNSHSFSG